METLLEQIIEGVQTPQGFALTLWVFLTLLIAWFLQRQPVNFTAAPNFYGLKAGPIAEGAPYVRMSHGEAKAICEGYLAKCLHEPEFLDNAPELVEEGKNWSKVFKHHPEFMAVIEEGLEILNPQNSH